MQLVDLANFSLSALAMESTNLYSVKTAFVGVWISLVMKFMEQRLMGHHNQGAQTGRHQVFGSSYLTEAFSIIIRLAVFTFSFILVLLEKRDAYVVTCN